MENKEKEINVLLTDIKEQLQYAIWILNKISMPYSQSVHVNRYFNKIEKDIDDYLINNASSFLPQDEI